MNLGTHNSATSGKLVWWQRPFSLSATAHYLTYYEKITFIGAYDNFMYKYEGEEFIDYFKTTKTSILN
jgi:hypothetical protein